MQQTPRRAPARPTIRAALAALVMALAVATPAAAGSAGPPPTTPSVEGGEVVDLLDKVDAEVLDKVEAAPRETTTFWVDLAGEADLSGAEAIDDWAERGRYVVDALKASADARQAEVRARLDGLGATYTPYWVSNRIRVTGNEEVVKAMAAVPAVESITAPEVLRLGPVEAAPAAAAPTAAGVEWGVAAIGADDVWDNLDVRGDGIVVGTIDTGAEAAHPALAAQYRGNDGGRVTSDYAWFDGFNLCPLGPCDYDDHGTHVVGTMVGDDGDPGPHRIGVAPHARWISARGCMLGGCYDEALLLSAQWMLAPTDAAGANPRPDLRPHIVNNSWGSEVGGNPWFEDVVTSWRAAGMFPMFGAGNEGPACGTGGSPGDYPDVYAAGSFDESGAISDFSARGKSPFDDEIKPNLAAPGEWIVSSVGTNSYGSMRGTSMASPHVAGTVALMWSAAPQLIGRVDLTAQILDDTAQDVDDQTCGGTADDNNVFGEGRLDAMAAVQEAVRVVPAVVQGRATDTTGAPAAGVGISFANGGFERTMTTGPDGHYELYLLAGPYTVSVEDFYFDATAQQVDLATGLQTLDFELRRKPAHDVSGRVLGRNGPPVVGAVVTLVDTPVRAVTGPDGSYRLPQVPDDSHRLRVDASAEGACLAAGSHVRELDLEVDQDELLDVKLDRRADGFGYSCGTTPAAWVDGTTPITPDAPIALPFPVRFYGRDHSTAYAAAKGILAFGAPAAGTEIRRGIPSPESPNGAIYGFWDDEIYMDSESAVLTGSTGQGADRQFVVEWRNLWLPYSGERLDLEILLSPDGTLVIQYRGGGGVSTSGEFATIGIEDPSGRNGIAFGIGQAVIPPRDFAVRYVPPPVPRCNGLTPTIVGTAGDDELLGTAGNDVIVDLWGSNVVRSRAGNDTICTGDGADTIESGNGTDWIDAGNGTNHVQGGDGADTITAGSGDDEVLSGPGADVVNAGSGTNVVTTAQDDDFVETMGGNDTISTGTGADEVFAGHGNNKVELNDGDDIVIAGLGNDTLSGGRGTDKCIGNGGTDTLRSCELT